MNAFGNSRAIGDDGDIENLIYEYGLYDKNIHTYQMALDTINVELVNFHFERSSTEENYRMSIRWLESPSIQSAELTRLFVMLNPALVIFSEDKLVQHHIIYGNIELVMYLLQVDLRMSVFPMEHMIVRRSTARLELASLSSEMWNVVFKHEQHYLQNPIIKQRVINSLKDQPRILAMMRDK